MKVVVSPGIIIVDGLGCRTIVLQCNLTEVVRICPFSFRIRLSMLFHNLDAM